MTLANRKHPDTGGALNLSLCNERATLSSLCTSAGTECTMHYTEVKRRSLPNQNIHLASDATPQSIKTSPKRRPASAAHIPARCSSYCHDTTVKSRDPPPLPPLRTAPPKSWTTFLKLCQLCISYNANITIPVTETRSHVRPDSQTR